MRDATDADSASEEPESLPPVLSAAEAVLLKNLFTYPVQGVGATTSKLASLRSKFRKSQERGLAREVEYLEESYIASEVWEAV